MARAAEPEAAGEEGAAPKPKRRRRFTTTLATIFLGLAGLAGGLAAAMGPRDAIALLTGAPMSVSEETATAEEADGGGHGGGGGGHGAAAAAMTVTPFKEIIVNITSTTASGRQTSRFLKLNVALVYDAAVEHSDNIEARKLYLRDSFQDYLRQLSERDLQGSYGLAMLKTELLRRARAIADSDAPKDILISDLIVQ